MFGELPLHPLIVHGVIIFTLCSCAGAIALAVRPYWRHRYGTLLVLVNLAGVVFTWLSIWSGDALTKVPGLGSPAHKAGGELLLELVVPLAALVIVMVSLDRWWSTEINKHGEMFRDTKSRQPWWITAVCGLVLVASGAVIVQTALVGHSGAQASWGDVDVNSRCVEPVTDACANR